MWTPSVASYSLISLRHACSAQNFWFIQYNLFPAGSRAALGNIKIMTIFFIRKQILNHTEKIQSNLSLKVRILPYPIGSLRPKAGLRPFPQQSLSSSLRYSLFWALSSKLLHHIQNFSGISIFKELLKGPSFNSKEAKGGMISAVP